MKENDLMIYSPTISPSFFKGGERPMTAKQMTNEQNLSTTQPQILLITFLEGYFWGIK